MVKIQPSSSVKSFRARLDESTNDTPIILNGENFQFKLAIYEWRD